MGLFDLFKKKKASYKVIEVEERTRESVEGGTYTASHISLEMNGERHVELVLKDERSIFIDVDGDYEPIADYRDFLIDNMGFKLTAGYGITDIIYEFTYDTAKYCLRYSCDLEGIMFLSCSDDPKKVHTFREVAAKLFEFKEQRQFGSRN